MHTLAQYSDQRTFEAAAGSLALDGRSIFSYPACKRLALNGQPANDQPNWIDRIEQTARLMPEEALAIFPRWSSRPQADTKKTKMLPLSYDRDIHRWKVEKSALRVGRPIQSGVRMAAAEAPALAHGTTLLEEMTTAEVRDALTRTDAALLPTGAIEQHGGHLPLGTDWYLGVESYLRIVAELARRGHQVVAYAPPISQSDLFKSYPGTLTLSTATLIAIQREILICLP